MGRSSVYFTGNGRFRKISREKKCHLRRDRQLKGYMIYYNVRYFNYHIMTVDVFMSQAVSLIAGKGKEHGKNYADPKSW